MKWKLLFLVCVLVLLPVFLFSQSSEKADITKAELTTLLTERENSKKASIAQEANFQKILNQLEAEHQNDLTKLENKYDQKIALLEIESDLRMDSLTILKKETAFNYWKGFLSGSIAGFGLGFGLSF